MTIEDTLLAMRRALVGGGFVDAAETRRVTEAAERHLTHLSKLVEALYPHVPSDVMSAALDEAMAR